MNQQSEKTIIELKSKVLTLEIKDFGSSEIDIEDLLQIDTHNLLADIVTWPVIFNRISNIKAEVDGLLRETQLDFTIFEAQLFQEHKKRLLGEGEKATEATIDAAIKIDVRYRIKKLEVINVQKQADIIDGLYWSAKSKDKKLEVISAKVKPEDFEKEILEGVVNSVMIRVHKNLFPNKR